MCVVGNAICPVVLFQPRPHLGPQAEGLGPPDGRRGLTRDRRPVLGFPLRLEPGAQLLLGRSCSRESGSVASPTWRRWIGAEVGASLNLGGDQEQSCGPPVAWAPAPAPG